MPPDILKQLQRPTLLSCSFISEMPEFNIRLDIEGQLQRAQMATSQQLQWQKDFLHVEAAYYREAIGEEEEEAPELAEERPLQL